MRTKKCIIVTPENEKMLNERFETSEERREPITPGYYLIAPFDSQDVEYDLITREKFIELYYPTGERLQNGFFVVKER